MMPHAPVITEDQMQNPTFANARMESHSHRRITLLIS